MNYLVYRYEGKIWEVRESKAIGLFKQKFKTRFSALLILKVKLFFIQKRNNKSICWAIKELKD